MHFTIGSVSGANNDSNNFDLSEELKLVRTGLIYADQIELVSVGSSVLKSMSELRAKTGMEIARLVTRYPNNLDPELVEILRRFVRRQNYPKWFQNKFPQDYETLMSVLGESQRQLSENAEEFVEAYDAKGFEEALNTGRVDLYRFRHTTVDGLLSAICEEENWNPGGAADDMAQEYADKTITALQKESTYPLFDSEISDTIDRLVSNQLILPTPSAVEQSKHGGLANHLFQQLPNFDTAPMDEIVDIRSRLEEPLGNFRKAVGEYSEHIKTAQWSGDFAKDAERVFEEKVKPSVDHLNEELGADGELKRYLKDFAVTVAPEAVSSGLQAFIAEPSAIGPIVSTAWAGGYAYKRHKDQVGLRKNEVYFYYQTEQRLKGRG